MNYNLDEMIKLWFAEDIGDGDHTTLSSIPADAMGKQQLIIKEDGILAGVEVAKRIFNIFDPNLKMTQFLKDGDAVKKGDIAFVAQLQGGRLPEGSTTLPEGFSFKFLKVIVE